MKIDFHVHSSFTRQSLNPKYTRLMLDTAIKEGLDGIVILEHIDSDTFIKLYEYLKNNFTYNNGYYNYKNLKIFCGVEIKVDSKYHLIIVSNLDKMLKITRKIIQLNGLNFNELNELVKNDRENIVLLGAHPFNEKHNLLEVPLSLLRFLDGFQLNVAEANAICERQEFLKKEGFNVVLGTDSHHPILIGGGYTEFDNEIDNIADIKSSLKSATNIISDDYIYKYKYNRLASKSLKKIML